MPKKLISFIGAGRRAEGEPNTYQKTIYQFPDGSTFETSIFPEALMARKEVEIGECVLIGTHGSSWGCLIEETASNDDSLFSLYEKLEQQFDGKCVDPSSLTELDEVLTKRWEIPVRCHLHDSEINEENALSILFGYVEALGKTEGDELLIDITHGFRSMPVLLMGAIQTLDAIVPQGIGIEIIYGEYKHEDHSPVRYLKAVWAGVRFARALRFFNEQFDAELLAEILHKDWPEGAKAITRIGGMIQANFFTRFDEALSQLRNALDGFGSKEQSDQILVAARELERFHKRLSTPKQFHERLLALAEILAERRSWGQALMTLQLAMEASLFIYYSDVRYGDYEVTKELSSQFPSNLKSRKERNAFHRLRNTRNTIAHGGSKSREGGIPQEGNLPKQFENYRNFLKRTWNTYSPFDS